MNTSRGIQTGRRSWNDLTPPPPLEDVTPAPAAVPPGPLSSAAIDDIVDRLGECGPYWPRVERHQARMRTILAHLDQLPGETWQDRWTLFEGQVENDSLTWRTTIAGATTKDAENRNEIEALNAAMGPLLALDVMRPSHRWLAGQRFAFWKALSHYRDHTLTPPNSSRP